MQLNQAVSARLCELLAERGMTQYQLYMKSGVPKSSIGNVINCAYDSVKLRIVHEMCQGLGISVSEFLTLRYLMRATFSPRISSPMNIKERAAIKPRAKKRKLQLLRHNPKVHFVHFGFWQPVVGKKPHHCFLNPKRRC